MIAAYMLDTNICSFIMRERPLAVLDRTPEIRRRLARPPRRRLVSGICPHVSASGRAP